MSFIQIKETCLYVKNLRKTMAFYQDLLGLKTVSYVKDSHIYFQVGSSMLLCFLSKAAKQAENQPMHYGYGKNHLALEVEQADFDGLKETIEYAEIEIEKEYVTERGVRGFYFRDPDGHLIEIIEPGLWL